MRILTNELNPGVVSWHQISMEKRLVFSNSTPNDQDGIITNDVIIFERYSKNPILLKEHMWYADPLGTLSDIKIIDGKFSAIPIFHCETQASREAKGMYDKGSFNGASIGGAALWEKNDLTGEYTRDKNGYKICKAFYLYEVSLVALPSNPDAIAETLRSKIYDDDEANEYMESTLMQLSSKYTNMLNPASATPGAATTIPAAAAATTTLAAQPAPTTGAPAAVTTLAAEGSPTELPAFMKKIIENGGSITLFGSAPAKPTGPEPTSTQADKIPAGDPHPDPIGLAAKAKLTAGKKLLKATEKADKAIAAFKAKKKAADDSDEEDDEEMKSGLKTLQERATLATKECMDAEEEYDKACEAADEEEKEKMNGGKPATTTLGSSYGQVQPAQPTGPQMKTTKQIAEEMKLAAQPSFKATVGAASQGVTFTRLNSSKADANDKRILERLFNKDKSDKVDVSVHGIVLNAMLNDKRIRPVLDKTRIMQNTTESQMHAQMKSPDITRVRGTSLEQFSTQLNSGQAKYWNRSNNQMDNLTYLTTTDAALASPALNTIEWLSLAIFELFPTTSWKAPIPMFSASMASANTGFIWANILANPAVYMGNSPAPATDYTTTDGAVALSLTPYYLQPMVWNPLYMHQLRYDQQSSGWAQAFSVLNATIDDNLIYTVASTVPASARIATSGKTGNTQNGITFNIPSSGPGNTFYWNNVFAGDLNLPVLNDILAIEQIYRNQNFQLEREKAMLVLDSIGERYLAQDPETKSMLTRFISSNAEEFLGYKHTQFDVRSRVAVYDLATNQVKNINGAIPATSVSAMLGFMPSQLGMGIGMLDVYMIQDPTNYAYRMSAALRIGIAPLRANFFGTTLYYFQTGNV